MEDMEKEFLMTGDKIEYNKEGNCFRFDGNEVYFDVFNRPYVEHENK